MPETFPTSPSGVEFEELEGSPRIRCNEDGLSGMRRFKLVKFTDWPTFMADLVGQYSMTDAGGNPINFWQTGAIVTYSPAQASFPGYDNCLVSDVEVLPFQPESPDNRPGGDIDSVTFSSQTNTYDENNRGALVIAQYNSFYNVLSTDKPGMGVSPSTGPLPGTYLIYEQDVSGEILTVPGRTFYWQGSDPQEQLSADLNPGIVIPSKTLSLIWARCIAPPWSTMDLMVGKVNQDLFLGASPGTMMFVGCQARRTPWFQPSGTLWKLIYRFVQQSKFLSDNTKVGWNYLFKKTRLAGEHWVTIAATDGNDLPHGPADFYQLFQYGN